MVKNWFAPLKDFLPPSVAFLAPELSERLVILTQQPQCHRRPEGKLRFYNSDSTIAGVRPFVSRPQKRALAQRTSRSNAVLPATDPIDASGKKSRGKFPVLEVPFA
jgi:hypothetical protein